MWIQREDGEAEEGIASDRRETWFSVARDGRREERIQMRVIWGICSCLMNSSRIFYIDRLRSPKKMVETICVPFLPFLFLHPSKSSAGRCWVFKANDKKTLRGIQSFLTYSTIGGRFKSWAKCIVFEVGFLCFLWWWVFMIVFMEARFSEEASKCRFLGYKASALRILLNGH